MHLFRTEMLFFHPPAQARPRYGSRGARRPRYGRVAMRDAGHDKRRDAGDDHAQVADVATACTARAFARMQAA